MNTQIINAELALALRKCLPFVRRHAIISGGDGALTYAFAVRALADADARQQEEQRVKNIVAAEQAKAQALDNAIAATLAHARAYGIKSAREVLDRFGVKNVRAAAASQHASIERAMNMSPFDWARADEKGVSPISDYRAGAINAADAKMQAARAVRPGEGYLPAAPPAKGCNCDTCTQYRRTHNGGFDPN